MATWNDLTGYIRSNYKIASEREGLIKLIFDLGDLRSQVVLITRHALIDGEEEWIMITSPVANLGSVNLEVILREVGEIVCGGAALEGDVVVIKHAAPLLNLDINELERPLRLVTATADRLERELVGNDVF